MLIPLVALVLSSALSNAGELNGTGHFLNYRCNGSATELGTSGGPAEHAAFSISVQEMADKEHHSAEKLIEFKEAGAVEFRLLRYRLKSLKPVLGGWLIKLPSLAGVKPAVYGGTLDVEHPTVNADVGKYSISIICDLQK